MLSDYFTNRKHRRCSGLAGGRYVTALGCYQRPPSTLGRERLGRSKRSLFSENNLSLRPERLLGMTGSRMVGGGGGFFIPRLLSQLLPAIVFSNKDCLCVFFLSFFLIPSCP